MVAPRIAAFDEAIMAKSLPVMPSRTSIFADVFSKCAKGRDVSVDGARLIMEYDLWSFKLCCASQLPTSARAPPIWDYIS
jgi:hypothetical protein